MLSSTVLRVGRVGRVVRVVMVPFCRELFASVSASIGGRVVGTSIQSVMVLP